MKSTKRANDYLQLVKNKLGKLLYDADCHHALAMLMRWNPRKDGKPRAELSANFGDEHITEFVEISYNQNVPIPNAYVKFKPIPLAYAKVLGFDKEVGGYFYELPPIHASTEKELFDVVKKALLGVIHRHMQQLHRDVKSVMNGKYRKLFLDMVNATNAYRKEFHNFQKHKDIANSVIDACPVAIYNSF